MREGVKIRNKLKNKLIDNPYLNEKGIIREDCKFKITIPELKIKNSKILGKTDDKFETILFLPDVEGRKGEGGLRTRGYFKFSYKLVGDAWYCCDLYGNPLKPAHSEIQQEITNYLNFINQQNLLDPSRQITELPLITVITVVLNGSKYLEKTIQSVINQTYPNVEYIIIDGGSTDGTLDIIRKYEHEIDYWVSEKDKGIYDAMNKGIDLACGKWINFMNAGDEFYDLDSLSDLFSKNFNININDVIYGDYVVQFEDYFILRNAEPIDKIIYKMNFHHQSSFTKTVLMKEHKFNMNYRIAADYDFFLKIFLKNSNFFYLKLPICRVIPDGLADKRRIQVIREYYNSQKNLNINSFKNFIYFIYRIFEEVMKRILKTFLPQKFLYFYRKFILAKR